MSAPKVVDQRLQELQKTAEGFQDQNSDSPDPNNKYLPDENDLSNVQSVSSSRDKLKQKLGLTVKPQTVKPQTVKSQEGKTPYGFSGPKNVA